MDTIWKYEFDVTDEFEIYMPIESFILEVQLQSSRPCMWALVNTNNALEKRNFRVFGTGNPFDLGDMWNWNFIGTFQSPPFVWHLFEVL